MREKLTWSVVVAAWIVAIVAYRHMPDRMATHWNAQGVVNGYSGRLSGLLLIPAIMLGIQIFFMVIPHIDPMKENINAFKRQFDGFTLLIALFLAYLLGVVVVWNGGVRFSMSGMMAPAFGLLFYGIGALLKGIKRNWFIGIRTPWTLSSDEVWDRTHEMGSTVFKIVGALAVLGAVFPAHMILFMLGPVIVGSLGIVVYSYMIFRQKK